MSRPRALGAAVVGLLAGLLAAASIALTVGPVPAGAAEAPHVLHAGEALVAGTDHFALSNGWYSLETYSGEVSIWETVPVPGPDGLSSSTAATWDKADPTGRFHAAHDHTVLRLRRNGDLALVTSRGRQLWHSGTRGSGAVLLTLRRHGTLVLTTATGRRVWTSQTGQMQMGGGMGLAPGHRLRSNVGASPETLTMQRDGNLVHRCGRRVDWQTRTRVRRSSLVLGTGGNLRVVSPDGRTVWASHSGGHDYAHLDSDHMYIAADDGAHVVWAADTGAQGC